MEKKFVCIVCPLGCQLSVQLESGSVREVTGHTCPRGKAYAENECTDPRRTVTTTVRCSDGGVVAVKTEQPIPKDKMAECMQILNGVVAQLPVCVGDVILEDVLGSRILATQNKCGGNNEF